MRAVILDTVGDAVAAAGAAVAGAVIALTHRFYWLDPAVALAIGLAVGLHALWLLRDVVHTLRRPPECEATPL